MTIHKLEKKRSRFLEKFKSIANTANNRLFDDAYQIEVYFSGRDEDFIVISFRTNVQLIELSIGLINHQYELIGNEQGCYKSFKIENGQFNEVLQDSFTFPEDERKMLDLILEKLKNNI